MRKGQLEATLATATGAVPEAGMPHATVGGAAVAVAAPDVRVLRGHIPTLDGVRGREVRVPLHHETLSHTRIPKVALPQYRSWGDRLEWLLQENVPGEFPYTAGVFQFKRTTEDPTRMFAGEGPPEQTNARFHYLSEGMPARRLSTAFDSVTLYGSDPHERPDIYGKVGNSGVSIATVDDAKKLYSGFDLDDPATSVSMTINGPAPMILAFFLNAAIDQACETYITEHDMWDEVEAKIDAIYGDRPRPRYEGDLPSGNNGLGLRLLGVSGDQVLSAQVYEELKAKTMSSRPSRVTLSSLTSFSRRRRSSMSDDSRSTLSETALSTLTS